MRILDNQSFATLLVVAIIALTGCEQKLPPRRGPAPHDDGPQLTGPKSPGAPTATALTVQATKKSLDLDPLAAVWTSAKEVTIDLTKQVMLIPFGGGTIKNIAVRALHNGDHIAFRLSWADATKNLLHGIDSFRDGVALEFPVERSKVTPAPFMGHKGSPVNIWQWRSDWQAALEGKKIFDKRQPLPAGYYITSADDNILKKLFPRLPRPRTAAIEYVAEGWGTLTRHVQQDVQARGTYKDGHWFVVFRRKLERTDGSDADLVPGTQTHINFAVWDGGKRQVNGMKSVKLTWTTLTIEAVSR